MTVDHPAEEIGALIRETYRAMIRNVEYHFDDSDIAFSQWLTLKLIDGGRIACIGDVNRELGLESGASTRLVDQLEIKGLLRRCRSSVDRRVVGISLTENGEMIIQGMRPRLAEFWRAQLEIFSDDERDQLFAMLLRLRGRLLASIDDGQPVAALL